MHEVNLHCSWRVWKDKREGGSLALTLYSVQSWYVDPDSEWNAADAVRAKLWSSFLRASDYWSDGVNHSIARRLVEVSRVNLTPSRPWRVSRKEFAIEHERVSDQKTVETVTRLQNSH